MTRTSTPTEYIKLTGTRLRETDKAIHFRVEQVGDTVLKESLTSWFPISQISKMTFNTQEGADVINVARWICESKELI